MFYGWIKSLIIYLIFSGMIINLAPSGNYKKFIKLFAGIITIIILIKPISYIFNKGEYGIDALVNDFDRYSSYDVEMEEYKEIYDYYDMSLSESIKLRLKEQGYGIQEVTVITDRDNNIVDCKIFFMSDESINAELAENNIKNYISQVYNLNIDSIYIVRR